MSLATQDGTAKEASARAFIEIQDAIAGGKSFLVEAGAGAGKTYSLIETLQHLIQRRETERWPEYRRVACITYTNVAKDEIVRRVDAHELVQCDTIHGFCWAAVSPFQAQLRENLEQVGTWKKRLESGPPLERQPVVYDRGYPKITEERISLGHDDVPKLMVALLAQPRFRTLLADRFPCILVDEYQDSNAALMSALTEHFAKPGAGLTLGFFGDHWQQIYPGTCGKLVSNDLVVIEKGANFRSTKAIIDVLNRMREELPQAPDREDVGTVAVYHTNAWPQPRQRGGRWEGDLSAPDAQKAVRLMREQLDWDEQDDTKILMLTHRLLGDQQGYPKLVDAFKNNETLNSLDDPHLAFIVDTVEPVCHAFEHGRFGEMFDRLGDDAPLLQGASDKRLWNEAMLELLDIRSSGTVDDVLAVLRRTGRPRLPGQLEEREHELSRLEDAGEDLPRQLTDLPPLKTVPYVELERFSRFHDKLSPFATKHGVKGAEFDDVLVVASRGWANYNFNEMLELAAGSAPLSADEQKRLERNRNLFYVACSRPRNRLTVLFTQELTAEALSVLADWFGQDNVHEL